MLNFFKSRPQDLGIKAHPLSINPLPHSNEAILRHARRIQRLMMAVKKAEAARETSRVHKLIEEIERRRAICKATGIDLPGSIVGFDKFVEERGG